MIRKQATQRQLIADGDENDIVKMSISKHESGTIIGIDDLKNFGQLAEDISQADAEAIAADGNFTSGNGMIKAYKNADGLQLYYHQEDGIVSVFAYGEFQPARYKLYFEGSWQIK